MTLFKCQENRIRIGFLDIQATMECVLTLKLVRNVTRTYSNKLTYSYAKLKHLLMVVK